MSDTRLKREETAKIFPYFVIIRIPYSKQYRIVEENHCSYRNQDQCGEVGAAVTYKDPYTKEKHSVKVMYRARGYEKCFEQAELYGLDIDITTKVENSESDEENESSDDENEPYARQKQSNRFLAASTNSANSRASISSEQFKAPPFSLSANKISAKPAYSPGSGSASAVSFSPGTLTSFEHNHHSNISFKQHESRAVVKQENMENDELPDDNVAENQNNTMIMQGQLDQLRIRIDRLLRRKEAMLRRDEELLNGEDVLFSEEEGLHSGEEWPQLAYKYCVDQATGLLNKEKDLIRISGKDSNKYALNVATNIFTPDEMIDSVIIEANRKTDREPMDPVRVDIIRNAVSLKYNLSPAGLDKIWSSIRKAINTKGRNLKAKRITNSPAASPKFNRKTTGFANN